jgi:hemolysin activation/secretion protein
MKKALLYTIVYFLFSTIGFSQTPLPGPDAGKILQQENENNKIKSRPKEIPKNLLNQEEKKPKKADSTIKIDIKSFKLEGAIKAFPISELQNLLQDLNNQSLNFDQIQLAANRIENYYKQKGFFLAQAIIPKQEIKDGIVIVLINEGKLDSKEPYKINKKNLRISEDKVKAYMNESLKDEFLLNSIERGILNIKDNPGLAAAIELEPGSDEGSTRIILDLNEGPLLTGSVNFDNYGNRYTGDLRSTGSVDINDPSAIGDHINILATKAIEGDFELKKLSYDLPIGVSGLRAGTSYSVIDFKIGKELTANRIEGKAEDINLNFKYPVYRSVSQSILTNFNYDKKYLYNTALGAVTSDKVIDNYILGITLQKTDQIFGGGFTQANINYTSGDLDLSKDSSSLNADRSGFKTNGNFNKQNIQLTRIQNISEKINININADMQFASKNLDSSEKMSLGGPAGIRAYPAAEASGDEGYKYNLEAKYNFGNYKFLDNLSGSVFYDYGKITQYKEPGSTANNNYSLSGYGINFDANISQSIFAKLTWSHTNGGNPGASTQGNDSDGQKNKDRFWFITYYNF